MLKKEELPNITVIYWRASIKKIKQIILFPQEKKTKTPNTLFKRLLMLPEKFKQGGERWLNLDKK